MFDVTKCYVGTGGELFIFFAQLGEVIVRPSTLKLTGRGAFTLTMNCIPPRGTVVKQLFVRTQPLHQPRTSDVLNTWHVMLEGDYVLTVEHRTESAYDKRIARLSFPPLESLEGTALTKQNKTLAHQNSQTDMIRRR